MQLTIDLTIFYHGIYKEGIDILPSQCSSFSARQEFYTSHFCLVVFFLYIDLMCNISYISKLFPSYLATIFHPNNGNIRAQVLCVHSAPNFLKHRGKEKDKGAACSYGPNVTNSACNNCFSIIRLESSVFLTLISSI